MNLYKLVMILYVLIINILFYTSGNLLVIILSTIANFLAILTIIGFVVFSRNRKQEKQAREQRRAKRNAK